jgi:hypothetical protein
VTFLLANENISLRGDVNTLSYLYIGNVLRVLRLEERVALALVHADGRRDVPTHVYGFCRDVDGFVNETAAVSRAMLRTNVGHDELQQRAERESRAW